MTPIKWPKLIKLADVVDIIDDLNERIANLEAYVVRNDQRITALEQHYNKVILERGERITQLEAAVATTRSQQNRQAWAIRTGRNL